MKAEPLTSPPLYSLVDVLLHSGLLAWLWLVSGLLMIYEVKPFATDRIKNFC